MSARLLILLALAVAQGGFIIGLSIIVFYYYLPKRNHAVAPAVRWHILTVAFSYTGLTVATIITVSRGVYRWDDFWFWLVFCSYIIGDVSLLLVMNIQFKKHAKGINN